MLDNTLNQPSKCKTKKKWDEINDESRETYNEDNKIRFKTSKIRLSLCIYSDSYVLVKGTITIAETLDAGTAASNANKKIIFRNCVPFIICISRINSTQVDVAHL